MNEFEKNIEELMRKQEKGELIIGIPDAIIEVLNKK